MAPVFSSSCFHFLIMTLINLITLLYYSASTHRWISPLLFWLRCQRERVLCVCVYLSFYVLIVFHFLLWILREVFYVTLQWSICLFTLWHVRVALHCLSWTDDLFSVAHCNFGRTGGSHLQVLLAVVGCVPASVNVCFIFVLYANYMLHAVVHMINSCSSAN